MPCSITVVGRAAAVPHQRVEVGDVHERDVVAGPRAGDRCGRRGRRGVVLDVDRRQVDPGRRPVHALQPARAPAGAAARRRRAPRRAAVRGHLPDRRRPRPGARPAAAVGPRSGTHRHQVVVRPATNAVVQEPCTCQSRILMPAPPPARPPAPPPARSTRGDPPRRRPPRAEPSTGTGGRAPGTPGPGCPGTARPGRRAARRARRRAPSARRHDRREQRDDRRADRGGQVRRAGVADHHASAPASTAASSGRVGPPAQVDDRRRRRPAARALSSRSAGAGDHDRRAPAGSAATIRRGVRASSARAGTEAPGCTTT